MHPKRTNNSKLEISPRDSNRDSILLKCKSTLETLSQELDTERTKNAKLESILEKQNKELHESQKTAERLDRQLSQLRSKPQLI